MKKLIKGIIINHYSSGRTTPVKVIHTPANNIYFNLALEEQLFEEPDISMPILFLWRNSPTIVIGKHQNPWKECRVEEMKRDRIDLARRKTGGGAVYQDLNNTCFSFLTPEDKGSGFDYRAANNSIILKALERLGVKGEVSGRNDLTVDGRKFSGSAYRLHLGDRNGKGRKSLHHGTIMFSVDFGALQQYLNPNKKKLESKGVDSVISRVINLQSMYPHVNHGNFCEQMEECFREFYGNQPGRKETIEMESLASTDAIIQKYQRLCSWDWLYGECPYFKYTIEKKLEQIGLIEVTFEVEEGKISQCKIYSDCLHPDFISRVNELIVKGVKYEKQGINQLEQSLCRDFSENVLYVKMAEEFCEWIRSEI